MRKIIVLASAALLLLPSLSLAETYGSDFLAGSCTSFDNGNGTDCTAAYDNNLATRYDSQYDGTLPFGFSIDLGTSTTKGLAKIGVNIFVYQGSTYFLKTLQTFGSNDNSTWTQIGTSTIPNSGSDGQWDYFVLTTSSIASYRYYKFLAPDTYSTHNQVYYYEMEAYECTSGCTYAGGSSTSTTSSSTIAVMSPQLDFLLQLLVEAIFVAAGIFAMYWILKPRR